MASNPRIDFYKFTLSSKTGDRKTFKDFAKEELHAAANASNDDAFKKCFAHFIQDLEGSHAKNPARKQTITVIPTAENNPYLHLKPAPSIQRNVISGVINGGPYDKEAVVSNIADNADNSNLGKDRSVLLPYFIFVYIPQDYNVGFFAIHSYNNADNITALFRNYISNLFTGRNYKKAILEKFAPNSFQNEFRDGAVIESLGFSTTVLETTSSTDPIVRLLKEYNIKIEAVPKNKTISITEAQRVFDFFKAKVFRQKNDKELKLEQFEKKKLTAQNEVTGKTKVFEWNTRENEFTPTVYLDGRLKVVDGVPDFAELKQFCNNLFDDIKPEIRPDLYVTRAQ